MGASPAGKRRNEVLLFAALLNHGPYVDTSGLATRALMADCAAHGSTWQSSGAYTMAFSVFADAIKRETNGKRTKRIELLHVPEEYVDEVTEALAHWDEVVPEPEAPAAEETPEPEPVPPPAQDIVMTDDVVDILLRRVVSILDHPRQFEIKEHALRTAREQADAYRRRNENLTEELDQASRMLETKKRRIASLEAELAGVRRNLEATLRADRFSIDVEVRRELERLMRPGSGKG